ncbi:MAG TPA: NAD(P)/FAD-dependent oxidoreductase [Chloroflexia bacterium]|nr:NAD(P)/FAD-dependent oxidoreductase [Chloroflexia bacterium]
MYDAIVVGARCAGSPTAMLLARKGYRVLLVDRATFPSDTLSTHGLHMPAGARLKKWGLLDAVIASNAPPIGGFVFDLGFLALQGTPPPADGVAVEYAPRRTVLDKILLDGAAAAGVEVREGFTVDELTWEGEQVTGIIGHGKGGPPSTEQARIVIGADGRHSTVAAAARAPAYEETPPLTCFYYTYWSNVPVGSTEIYIRERRNLIAFQTNDGLTCVGVQWPHAEFADFRTDVEKNYLQTIDLVPGLAERVRQGRREERIVGTGDLPNFFRKASGPGWALVGDAGHHMDPVLAHGINDAFRDAELLVDALDAGLSGGQPMAAALATFEEQRNQTAMPLHQMTLQFASMEPPPPEMQQLIGALVGNQAQIDRFFGVLAGTVPMPEFFAPENIGQIMAAAAQRNAGGI